MPKITDTQENWVTGEIAGSATVAAMPAIAGKWVKFKANSDNGGNVYIGTNASLTKAAGTTTTTAGFELDAGQETDWLPVPNGSLASLYRICTNAGDDVTYTLML